MRYTTSALLVLIGNVAWAAQGGSEAVGSSPDRVAVLPLEILGDVPAGRPALEAAVLRGLTVVPVPAVQPEEIENRLRAASVRPPCEAPECWAAIGRSLQARYLVTGTVERKGPLFAVEFRVVDARMGRVLATESNRCDASECSVAELCRVVVREMARQTLNQEPEPPTSLPATATAAGMDHPAVGASATTPQLETAPAADQPATPWSARRWAIPVIAGGVLAGAAGGVMLFLDSHCIHFETGDRSACSDHHGSKENQLIIGGVAALGLGAALVTTGVVLLFSGEDPSDSSAGRGGVKVSVGPAGVGLSGRF